MKYIKELTTESASEYVTVEFRNPGVETIVKSNMGSREKVAVSLLCVVESLLGRDMADELRNHLHAAQLIVHKKIISKYQP